MLERGTFIPAFSNEEEIDSLNEFSIWNSAFEKKYLDKSFLERIGLKKRSK